MKLEDLNRKNVFKTPENYFEELPSRVQSRASVPQKQAGAFSLIWKIALPAFVIVLAFFLIPSKEIKDPTFDSAQIVAYLEESNVTAIEIFEEFEVDKEMLADLIADEVSLDESSIENELEWAEVETLLLQDQ